MKGMFIIQCKVLKMVLIQLVLWEGELVLVYCWDWDDYMVILLSGLEQDIEVLVQVWEDSVKVKFCCEEVNEWFSDQLGIFCWLVYLLLLNV